MPAPTTRFARASDLDGISAILEPAFAGQDIANGVNHIEECGIHPALDAAPEDAPF